jgi:hypothetical protein
VLERLVALQEVVDLAELRVQLDVEETVVRVVMQTVFQA